MTITLEIAQVVETVQGESSFAGYPCALIRLAGCPLTCSYCDTEWARGEGSPASLDTLLERANGAGLHHVLVTGGEPLHQQDTPALLTALCDAGHKVVLETSGALSTAKVDARVNTILDIKCPSSGMEERMEWDNLSRLRSHDEVKLVLSDRDDYDYGLEVMDKHNLQDICMVHLSPVLGTLSPGELAGWMMADRLKARLSVQLHKVAWPDLW